MSSPPDVRCSEQQTLLSPLLERFVEIFASRLDATYATDLMGLILHREKSIIGFIRPNLLTGEPLMQDGFTRMFMLPPRTSDNTISVNSKMSSEPYLGNEFCCHHQPF
mmetsp:Transcript_22553/g.54993  ORF Transcript_22553/g.54993 Transcript_22553/m.54993 type:complete len:108 (+) Transcript_22553:576-899(+)